MIIEFLAAKSIGMMIRWFFPELKRFEAGDERDRAWRCAIRDCLPIKDLWPYALVLFFFLGVPLISLLGYQIWRICRGQINSAFDFCVGFLPGGLAPIGALAVVAYFPRTKIRTHLRRQLNKSNMPTCMNCGYDLTGNTSGICPECGERK